MLERCYECSRPISNSIGAMADEPLLCDRCLELDRKPPVLQLVHDTPLSGVSSVIPFPNTYTRRQKETQLSLFNVDNDGMLGKV